ncbi:MAG: ribosome maturation factor RimM [Desulfobacterales bacterium]|nr:ribosome maturation factor RimM [Desulfobacterales bacterium]
MSQVSSGSLLIVGKVIRPHGKRGLLRIASYAGPEASFLDAGSVFLRPVSGEIHEVRVTSVNAHKNTFLMRLKDLRSKDEAEAYKGADILINKDTLVREEDECFWYELLGLKVYLDTGDYLGRVSHIISARSNDVYVVREGEKEIFIPATHEVVKEIDLENEKMVISAMEGLLDLNEV